MSPWLLRRAGGGSFSFIPLKRQEMGTRTRVVRGIIDEIRVLSPNVRPAEPHVRVAWLGEEAPERPASSEIYHPPGGSPRPNAGHITAVRMARLRVVA